MKIEKVEYWKLITNRTEFSNEKIGVTVVVEEDEKPQEALDRARRWVAGQFLRLQELKTIPDDEYEKALAIVSKAGQLDEDLPF